MPNLTTRIKLIDEMSAALDRIAQSGTKAMDTWEKTGSGIETAFDSAVTSTTQTTHSINDSTDAVELFNFATSEAVDATNAFSDAINKSSNSEEKAKEGLDKVSSSSEKAKDSVKGFGEESEKSGEKSEEFGEKAVKSLESLESILVAAGITKLVKNIGDAFVSCVEDAIAFESAITGVYKTVDGTPEQLAEISEGVEDLSLKIPSTTGEIAGVAEAAGQLGIATDDVMDFTKVMIDLGETTNLSADEAASSLAKFTNITSTSAEDYDNLGSTVVALGNNFATTEADIVGMSTRMASAATLAGMTESDILALAASLSSVGIEAEAGGSAMSNLIAKMQLSVETGNEQLEQFAQTAGMTAEQFKDKWGEDAANALYLFIDGLQDTERNGKSATAILDDMGLTEIRLSNAIKALSNNSDNLGNALEFSNDAWEENTALAKEAETRYGTLESKFAMTKNAATNLSKAVGDVFTPTIDEANDFAQEALEWLTGFVKGHPEAVKAISAITVGVTVFTGAIAAATVAVKAATVVSEAFTAVTGSVFLPIAGIVAGTAAIAAFTAACSSATEEEEKLTAVSQVEKDKIDQLEERYKRMSEQYGESSYQAQELKWQIEDLTTEYEANKQTVEEWETEIEESRKMYEEYSKQRDADIKAAELESDNVLNLATRLDTLADKTSLSSGEQQEMLTIIEKLNSEVPGLAVKYDSLSGKITGGKDAIMALAKAEADRRKYEAYSEDLIKSTEEQTRLEDKAAEAVNEHTQALEWQRQAQKKVDDLKSNGKYEAYLESLKTGRSNTGATQEWSKQWGQYETDLYEANRLLNLANEAEETSLDNMLEQNNELAKVKDNIDETSNKMAELSGSAEAAFENTSSAGEAVDAMALAVSGLAEEYNEAYEAAKTSFDGQYGLFDEAKANMESTVESAQQAMESQLNYWEQYNENVDYLKGKSYEDLNITETQYNALMAYVQDGSEEAAGLAQSMVNNIKGGNEEAVKKLAETVGKVETERDKAAKAVAEWQIDFEGKMKEFTQNAEKAVKDLDLSSDAEKAGYNLVHAYANAIKAQGGTAIANAYAIRDKVQAALSSSTETPTTDMPKKGYATGTDYATPGMHLVGENGPELVMFKGGEKVYTNEETEGIIARSAAEKYFSAPSDNGDNRATSSSGESSDTNKTIRLEINGGGSIDVDSSVSEETVITILQDNIKPVLASIVRQEIFEEGDGTYDY